MQKNISIKQFLLLAAAVSGLVLFGAKDCFSEDLANLPTISVAAEPSTVMAGGSVTISVLVPSTFSIISPASAMLESPAGTSYGPVSLSLSSGTSSTNWMGQFSLPAGCELGTWKVSRVYLTDSAGNARNYYYGNGISAAVVFSVIAGSNDTLETGDAPNTNDNGANPALDCTSIVYSAWSSCQNGSQSRTIGSSFPAGCSATNAVLTQACTVSSACTYFTYSDWSACSSTGQQTRTILSKYPSGCTGGQYESLSRTCNTAGTSTSTVSLSCTFTYSDWSACSSTGYQTRTITSKYPL